MADAFYPAMKATLKFDVSASSQSGQITNINGPIPVLVENTGTASVWFAYGDKNITASVPGAGTVTGADIELPAGSAQVFTMSSSNGPLYAAVIAAGATGRVQFTPGASGI
jgi:hypothetical protein